MPGQHGDCPQAGCLLTGLQGVGHAIADAACDAGPLRTFIADDLDATAHIKANPGRTKKPFIDWKLYKKRHQVECFFDKTLLSLSKGSTGSAASPCDAKRRFLPSWASFIWPAQ